MAGKTEKVSGALQENVLALVCTNDDHCRTVRDGIDLRLYSNEIFRTVAKRSYDFIDAHGEAPKDHLPDLLEAEIADKKEGRLYSELVHGIRLLGENLNIKYVVGQLGVFVQEHALRLGITEAAESLQNDDLDGARSHIEAALRRTAPVFHRGVTMLSILKELARGELIRDVFPVGIRELDRRDLGPARGELWMLVGAPKRGKTWGMIHATRAALLNRKRVLYITLEVSEAVVARRLVQSFTGFRDKDRDEDDDDASGIPQIVMKTDSTNGKKVSSSISYVSSEKLNGVDFLQGRDGRVPEGVQRAIHRITQLRVDSLLCIKSFAMGSLHMRELITYLDQLERVEKFVPDMVVLDYADLVALDTSNLRISIGSFLKDFRGLSVTRNFAAVTASQVNRPGASMRSATETDIAEDFSKIAVADAVIIMNQLPEEKLKGLARLYVAVARNERDKFSVLVTQNYAIGQFALASHYEPKNYREYLRMLQGGDKPPEGEPSNGKPDLSGQGRRARL